jgi:hypothetical protein
MSAAGASVLLAMPLRSKEKGRSPLGILLVEQFDEKKPLDSMIEDAEFVASQTAAALRNAVAHQQIFLGSVRGWLGRMLSESFRLRRLAIVALLVAVAAVLYFVPYELKLPGNGTLRAQQRRGVFAAESGTVREVLVRQGEAVVAGQTIAVLENTDLAVEHQRTLEELITVQETLGLKTVERGERGRTQIQQLQLDGEIAELAARQASLERQVELLGMRLEQLILTAPIDGTVVTWNPEQHLLNRPVQTGALLLQIIEEDGPWKLELEVQDADAGYISTAFEQRPEGAAGVPVEFALATQPEERYRGTMVEVAPRTEQVLDRHVVYMTVLPDMERAPPLHDGAEVRAKVFCGQRRLGFVMFREVIEFVQSRVLFLF